MARPYKTIPPAKEHFVGFRISEELHEVVQAEAKKAGLSESEYWRRLAANQRIRQRSIIIHDDSELLSELRQINKLGSNINQIARYFNQNGLATASITAELRHTLEKIEASCTKLDKAVEKEYGNR